MGNIDWNLYLTKLLKNWFVIALCCIIGVSGAFVYSEFFVTPQYSSSVKMVVKDSDWSQGVTQTSINTANQMIENCLVILREDVTFERVADIINEKEGTKYSASQLKNCVTYSRINETLYIKIEVQTSDPELSALICNAVVAVAPEMVIEYVANIPIVPLDNATISRSPVFPNTSRNMLLGFAVALVVACGAIFLLVFFDKTVLDEEKLKERYDLSVLGVVPDVSTVKKKHTPIR